MGGSRHRTYTRDMLLLLLACGPPTPPLDGFDLTPLATNRAAEPSLGELTLASGEDTEADLYWAHARGNLDASPAEVWAALQDDAVVVDRREVDEWTYAEAPELGFDAAYTVENVVRDILTVRYTVTWLHEVQLGDETSPERVVVHWAKTDGTPFIQLLEGTIELDPLPDGTTSLAFVEHLRAPQRDEATLEQYLTDLFADLEAHLADEPLPTF